MLRENSIFRKVNTKNEYVYVVEILKDSKEVKISPTSNEKEIETISISDFKKQYQKCFATLEENEKSHIEKALRLSGGKLSGPGGAAALLDVPRSTLQHRMRKLGIQ